MDNSVLNLKYSTSLGIILDLFKNEHITQNETMQLIEDLYNRSYIYSPAQNLENWKVTYTQ